MQKFFWYMVPLAVLWFVVMLVCTTAKGDGILLWLVLAVASVMALDVCLWKKMDRIERKLEELLEREKQDK